MSDIICIIYAKISILKVIYGIIHRYVMYSKKNLIQVLIAGECLSFYSVIHKQNGKPRE